MKRTVLAAVLVVALVLGVVAYATAETATVNATVNSQISLTIAEDAASGDWTSLTPGVAATPKLFNFTVKSNKPWTFTYDGVAYTPDDTLLDAVLSESQTSAFFDADDVAIPKGVSTASVTYSLDMLGDAAYQLDPAPATYQAVYTYTAAQ